MEVNFDRSGDAEDAVLTIDPWTKETGDDGDGTDIVHEIDVTSTVHSLYIKDDSNTGNVDISKAFPVVIPEGKVLRIKLYYQ
jgi:hypothetical protein